MIVLSHSIAATALDAEIGRADCSAVEAFGWRGQSEPSFLEAIEARRGVERAIDVLLHEHNRRPFGGDLAETLVDVAITTGASPSESSSHNKSRGFDISARPTAVICCWPPDRSVAARRRNSRSRGKSS